MHPFYVARLLNSLDHLTKGRIAFNVIASTRRADAANYGFDQLMEHDSRYDRMEEFIAVCRKLWDSVEPDAFVWNRETGRSPSRARSIRSTMSEVFKVRGPLNIAALAARPSGADPGRRLAPWHQGIRLRCRSRLRIGQPLKQKVQHPAISTPPCWRRGVIPPASV